MANLCSCCCGRGRRRSAAGRIGPLERRVTLLMLGLDGAGKTTAARTLAGESQRGKTSKRVKRWFKRCFRRACCCCCRGKGGNQEEEEADDDVEESVAPTVGFSKLETK